MTALSSDVDREADAALAGDWSLWRDVAVRSAGFPVSGLAAFGPGDESARLRRVARDARFREAVTWQNPAALANAVDKVAAGAPASPSDARRREQVVASYWQRYCAKNDTIGFFGPLAWGRIEDDGPPLRMRSGALVRRRAVHLEAWGVQALAQTLDPALKIAAGPHTERELRAALAAHPDTAVRERGLAALNRLEAARDALAAAVPSELRAALAHLDAVFVELTGREPVRNPGRAYGARTLAYVDCLRDLDVALGPQLLADLAPALQALFEASRWYCGEVHEIGKAILADTLPAGGRGAFGPVLARFVQALMKPPAALRENAAALERRFSALLTDPDPTTIGARAAAAFADAKPAWPMSVCHSVDVQLAARDPEAIAAGDYLAVIGDVHPGANPLLQGLFAHRAPDPLALLGRSSRALGPVGGWMLPPYAPGVSVEARGIPVTPETAVHIAAVPGAHAQQPRETWAADQLMIDGDHIVHPPTGRRVPLLEAVGMAIFVAGVRSFELLPDAEHAPRRTVGRVVLRRESWSIPATEIPRRAEDLPAFARDRGLPRRVFAKSPLERKPMYLDVESPALGRLLVRHARQAGDHAPGAHLRLTEMLPAPEDCWLADPDGERYVSELRLVAVDETRRAVAARRREPRATGSVGAVARVAAVKDEHEVPKAARTVRNLRA